VAFLALSVHCSEVVELDNSNFEKITQPSSGHTTGDWLVKVFDILVVVFALQITKSTLATSTHPF
jgi:hypothetical protein